MTTDFWGNVHHLMEIFWNFITTYNFFLHAGYTFPLIYYDILPILVFRIVSQKKPKTVSAVQVVIIGTFPLCISKDLRVQMI